MAAGEGPAQTRIDDFFLPGFEWGKRPFIFCTYKTAKSQAQSGLSLQVRFFPVECGVNPLLKLVNLSIGCAFTDTNEPGPQKDGGPSAEGC